MKQASLIYPNHLNIMKNFLLHLNVFSTYQLVLMVLYLMTIYPVIRVNYLLSNSRILVSFDVGIFINPISSCLRLLFGYFICLLGIILWSRSLKCLLTGPVIFQSLLSVVHFAFF